MPQYIDKAALVAEIERLISNGQVKLQESQESNDDESYVAWSEHIATCIKILSIIDTLKAKEVDIEKESELIANSIMISVQANLYHTNVYDYEKRCYKHSDLKDAARKGIELGLKAQKGE